MATSRARSAPVQPVDRGAVQLDPPVERQQAADGPQRRGLAGAVRPDDRDPLAGRHVKVHAVDHDATAEPDGEPAGRDRGRHGDTDRSQHAR